MATPPKDIEKQVYAEALRKAAQDYEELVNEFSLLRHLSDSIHVGLSFTEICRNLVQFVTEMMNVENASVMVTDPEKKELHLLVAKGGLEENGTLYIDRQWPGKAFKLGEGVAGRAADETKTILINDTLHDSRFVTHTNQKVKIRSLLSIPLIHEGRLHGVLNISNSSPAAFTEKKELALAITASTASIAMSYVLAVEQLEMVNAQSEDQIKKLAAVMNLSELLHTKLELNAIVEESLEAIMNIFSVDGVAIFLKEADTLNACLVAYKSKIDSDLKKLFLSLNEQYGREVLAAEEPLIIEQLVNEEPPSAQIRSLLVIPLHRLGARSGLLITISKGVKFPELEKRLLISYCSHIGVAIHNCKLFLHLQNGH